MSENKLHLEKSLYLKQHAENPIHWYAYGDEPLRKAKELNKLIFLSIGYSSCHWCHVMAHESFEDTTTANFLNEHFISIKVDREEYPDLDNYYQNVCSLMTGRGGWPLTIFLTPAGKPFIAGTYFPKVGKQGMPSFMDMLKHINQLHTSGDKTIYENADKIVEELKKPQTVEKKVEYKGHFPAPSAIMNALSNYADATNGGYGKAPKFPHFPFYEWTCEQILEGMIPKEQGQHVVETLEKMLMGGLYDHAKGGIHRYSVDDKFIVPHFEKMLYDQAGLLKVLSKLSQFYPTPIVFDGILQTLDYLQTEMVSDEGYFFSAQDADSEGQEGLYFTFTKEEFEESFQDAPAKQQAKLDQYLKYFNITQEGNFDHHLNVLSLNPAFKGEYYTQDGWQEIRDIRRRLLEQRKMRVPPATDRKGIAGWNYMLLSALADVVQYCPVDVIQGQALTLIQQTVEGCLKQFIVVDKATGKHIIRHANTLESQALYLEDYVSFSDAQIRLYEISGNETFKKNALETVDFILGNFLKDGQLYLTSIAAATPGFDNLVAPTFDQSYRSTVMTFVHLLHRMSVLDAKYAPEDIFGTHYAEFAQFALTNPLGHGEGLRALTYPKDIFRRVEVPLAWIEKPEFLEMRNHFFSRFVITYQDTDTESYQICTKTSCEVNDKGLSKFRELFKMQEPSDG
jgi:uncharacterized protein YyaL (SSP411 family)